jgi:hypothetical protein
VRRVFATALGLAIVVPLMAVMLVFTAASSQAQCSGAPPLGVSSARGVPSDLMVIYGQAAGRFQLGATRWAYLAAINEVETDFGHNLSVSTAGAVGWLQIEPGTCRSAPRPLRNPERLSGRRAGHAWPGRPLVG